MLLGGPVGDMLGNFPDGLEGSGYLHMFHFKYIFPISKLFLLSYFDMSFIFSVI